MGILYSGDWLTIANDHRKTDWPMLLLRSTFSILLHKTLLSSAFLFLHFLLTMHMHNTLKHTLHLNAECNAGGPGDVLSLSTHSLLQGMERPWLRYLYTTLLERKCAYAYFRKFSHSGICVVPITLRQAGRRILYSSVDDAQMPTDDCCSDSNTVGIWKQHKTDGREKR